MEQKKLFMLVEPSFMVPIWYSHSIEGLRGAAAKQRKTVCNIASLEELDGEEAPLALVIISTNNDWTRQMIDGCRARGIRPILVGGVPSRFGDDVSGTIYSNKSSVEEILTYFHSCGRSRLALLGINGQASNDMIKCETFLSTARALHMPVTYDDIYYNSKETGNPNEAFFDNLSNYNGVLCSNDYVAAHVLHYAATHGVSVPQELYVSGLGDSLLCRYTQPSLTSATRSYEKTGVQAYNIWKQMSNDPDVSSIVVTVQCVIKPRGSTDNAPLPQKTAACPEQKTATTLPEDTVLAASTAIRGLGNCLSQCGQMDIQIIQRLLAGQSTEAIAEQLFVANGTVRYRLKKIYNAANVNTKREFTTLFNRYINNPLIFTDLERFDENEGKGSLKDEAGDRFDME